MTSRSLKMTIIIATLLVVATGIQGAEGNGDSPIVFFDDRVLWSGSAATSGFTVTVEACASDGVISLIVLDIPEIGGPFSETPETTCAILSRDLEHGQPGEFAAHGQATDSNGAKTTKQATIRIELNPFDLNTVQGYPPLDQIPMTDLGGVVTIDTRVSSTGEVRGAGVYSNGKSIFSSMDDFPPESGDKPTSVTFNHLIGGAEFDVGAETHWAGLAIQSGPQWWQIEPLDLPVV